MTPEKPLAVQRRLAAILAADIAGYSRLMGDDEVATVRDLKSHQSVVLPMVAEFGGRIIDTAGDGILAEFPSAVGAVECATQIQKLMARRNEGVTERRKMQFRIGVNLGEVIHDDTRIFGDGINIAARLENIAEAGGICVSAKIHDEIDGKLDLSCVDLGVHELKNIAKPVHVYALNFAAEATTITQPGVDSSRARAPAPAPSIRRLSIVVLPFANANGDSAQDYFADGITEDVTTQLSSIKGSYVIGRNTAFRYKNKPIDVNAIGKELGVRYVLQGSVERLEQGVDTNVRLIDSVSGDTLWADTIEVDAAGVRNIRREVVSRMTIALNLPLINAEAKRSLIERPADPDVVDLVMQARATYYRRASVEGMQQARALFERALAIKPDDQPALVGLASTLVVQAFGWLDGSGAPLLDEADKVMGRAMPLDRRDAYAHYVMSRLRQMQGRVEAAMAENETALELNPNLVEAIAWSGPLHYFNGHPELGIEPLQKAGAQSPKDPMRWMWFFWLGVDYMLMGQYSNAILWFERSIVINPRYWVSLGLLAASYATAGDMTKAMQGKAQFDDVYRGEDLDVRRYSQSPTFLRLFEDRVMPGWRKVGIPAPPVPAV